MGRRVAIAGFVTSLLACLWLLPSETAADPAAMVRAGHDLFEQHCELCHGEGGKGDGPLSDELRVAPPNLTEIALRRGGTFPEVEVREIIDGRRRVRAHGHSEMPVWGRVFAGPAVPDVGKAAAAREKLDQLVVYLRSIQSPPAKDVTQR